MNTNPARFIAAVVAAIGLSLVSVACGSSSPAATGTATGTASSGTDSPTPTVYAAASLTNVFPMIDSNAKYTFAGSDTLQTQIEQGAPADVFAAASNKQPDALYAKGMVDKPVEFATNRLVLVVPKSNPAHITSVDDVTKPGVKLVICEASVPCGDYARNAFKHLGITAAAMKNVVSQQTDVTQTIAQIATGQGDAGFVYITDAKAAAGKVKVIPLPAKAKPNTKNYIAVVKGGKDQAAAKAFVAKVLSPQGQATLQAAGFGKP